MATPRIAFDDTLPALLREVSSSLGEDALVAGLVLRDTVGRLSFVADKKLEGDVRRNLEKRLHEVLGPYAPEEGLIIDPSDPAHPLVWSAPTMLWLRVEERAVRLVDRRIAGGDWMRAPAPAVPDPPRFVFASLKGGAGRSTALAVVAAHFAERGLRVLAVDLDLEAPGLGAFLLPEDLTPKYGMIDALVENGLCELDDEFLADLVGSSPITKGGGRIDVLPAFGARSLAQPAEVLAKLARAYAEDVLPDGRVLTILDQVAAVIARFSTPERYDLVLVDARAGLHETTAASVLGLGAEVLFFGRDERQTFQGYAALLAHLGRLVGPHEGVPEWVERLTPVHALAPADAKAREGFRERWTSLAKTQGPLVRRQTSAPVVAAAGVKDVEWDDSVSDDEVLRDLDEAELSLLRPIAVLRNSNYEGFDPLTARDQLSLELRRMTFGSLIDFIEQRLVRSTGETP